MHHMRHIMRHVRNRRHKTIILGGSVLLVALVAAGMAAWDISMPPPMPTGVEAFTGLAQPGLAVTVNNRTGRAFVAYGNGLPNANWVSMIDPTTTRIIHTTPVPGEPFTLALDGAGRRVFVLPHAATTASVLDARSGHLVRTIHLPLRPANIAFDDAAGLAVVSGYNTASTAQVVAIIDVASGAILHTVILGGLPLGGTGSGTVAVDGHAHRAFVVTAQGVEVLNTLTGARLYRSAIGMGSPDDIAIAANHIFVTLSGNPVGHCIGERCPSAGAGVLVLDVRDGHIIHRIPLGTSLCAPTADDHTSRIFIADRCNDDHGPGLVYVLNARQGTVARTTQVSKSPYAFAVDTQRGRVVVVSQGGTDVLDARSGALLDTTSWPGNAVAIDERTGRAVVATTFSYGPHGSNGNYGPNGNTLPLVAWARKTANSISLTHHVFGGVSSVRTSKARG